MVMIVPASTTSVTVHTQPINTTGAGRGLTRCLTASGLRLFQVSVTRVGLGLFILINEAFIIILITIPSIIFHIRLDPFQDFLEHFSAIKIRLVIDNLLYF